MGEIVFLGDSITEQCNWSGLFQDPRVKNHGIGGDTSDGILRRLAPIIATQPRQIFLMVGINDLWNGVPVDGVLANYRQILARCKSTAPTTQVFVQSVLPLNDGWSSSPAQIPILNAEVISLNADLQALAQEFRYTYTDLHSLLKKNDQLDIQYTYDGIHLNARAYMVWKSAIQHLVAHQ